MRRSDACSMRQRATPDQRRARPLRRSFIMLAVLVCMMIAMLVATGLLFISQTEAAGSSGSADAAQSRALLWSGAQAVMSRLADQRDRILAGELPELDSQMTMYESGSRVGVVRLLPFNDGRVFAPEAAKLDLNDIDAESLARCGIVDRATADAIVTWHASLGRPVQSISELLNVPGVTAETLYGSVENLIRISEPHPTENQNAGTGVALAAHQGLADILTVFSAEPAVQSNGKRRINLNVPWSEELGRRIEERFGAEAATLLKQVFESGTKFDSESSLVKAMRAYNTPPEQWTAILDAFTSEAGDMHYGRLDINAAPREALLALPGVTEEQAAQIVNVRQELSADERASIAWPVLNQILSPEEFEPLAGRVTTRCWSFRVRMTAGEASIDAPDGPLSSPLTQELVIDLAGSKPRIGYLRDITLLRDAALIAASMPRDAEQPFQSPAFDMDDAERAATPSLEQEAPAASRPNASGPARRPGRGSVAAASATADSRAADHSTGDAAIEPDAPRRIGRWTSGQSSGQSSGR